MIVNKYNYGGGGSGSGVTPQEVQAQIDSALTYYWESGETKDYVDTSLSGITIPDPTVLMPVAELPVSAETGAIMATKPSLGFWSTSGLQRIYTIVAESGNGDLSFIGENTLYHDSEWGYVSAQYALQYQSDDPDFVGWRLALTETNDEHYTAGVWDLSHEGIWGLMTTPLDESETKSLVCIWNAATNQLFFKAVVNATGEEVAFDFNALSPGTEGSVYQYLGTWNEIGGGDMSGYYTSAQTDEKIASAVTPVANHLAEVEQITASAYTELHDDILELSARTMPDMSLYTPTSGFSTINGSAITNGGNIVIQGGGGGDMSAYWNSAQTKSYVDSAATNLQDQIDTMDEVVADALNDLNGDLAAVSGAVHDFTYGLEPVVRTSRSFSVPSTPVNRIISLPQSSYDTLENQGLISPYTFYIIVNNS